jgi:hypothetical protein
MKAISTNPINLWASLALAVFAFVSALAPIPVHAGSQVPFRLTWAADITISPLAPPLVAVAGLGAGRATHLGALAAQSISETVNLDTGEGIAAYRFTAANGDDVLVTFVFVAIPSGPGTYDIQGIWQVTGGTGRFDGASGSGTYTGLVAFSGPVNAVGHFEAEGGISSPGSLK